MSKSSDAAIQADNDKREAKFDEALAVNNMRVWDKVSTTDPDHTKPVSFGRKFTAIDAHYQVKMATKQFGPIGSGWGYETIYSETHITDGRVLICCDLTFWWKSEGSKWEGNATPGYQSSFGPVRGCSMLVSLDKEGKLKPDTDAPKKAMTDALTKSLSHLGFNADVFLGMFDDNKYVERLRAEKKDDRAERTKFIKSIENCATNVAVDMVMKRHQTWLDKLDAKTLNDLNNWVHKQRTIIDQPAAADATE